MNARTGIIILVLLTILIGISSTSHAMTVFANLDGTEKSGAQTYTDATGIHYYVDITGTYINGCVNYTITSYTTGTQPARVEAMDATDGSDQPWLRNAKITNNSDSSCPDSGHIYFWMTLTEPPTTEVNPKVSVTVLRSAIGVFSPSTINNWITVNAYAQTPVNPTPPDGVSGTWQEICTGGTGCQDSYVVTCGTCGNFSKSKQRTYNPTVGQIFDNDRVYKGEFWFKLVNKGNNLIFDNATKGVKIRSTTGSGGGGGEEAAGAGGPH